MLTLPALPDHVKPRRAVLGAFAGDGHGAAEVLQGAPSLENTSLFSDLNFPSLKENFERDFIIRALKAFDGRINQTAENTKMTKVTLLRKLEKYGINPKQYHRS